MKYLIVFIVTAVALLFAYGAAFGEEISDVYQRVSPAVVTIHAPQLDIPILWTQMSDLDHIVNEIIIKKHKEKDVLLPFSPHKTGGAIGSGFIISTDGLIITNNHVIQGSGNRNITIVLEDGSERDVEVVGSDRATDIAVLKIVKSETDREFPTVAFGDSEKMKVGQQVFAVGSPYGINHTLTAGVISAVDRENSEGLDSPFDDSLQTDTPINPGNSGGPLFNMNGEVIGINQAIYSPSHTSAGLGFAIPSKYAKVVVTEIIKTGRFQQKHIGLVIIENTEMLSLVAGDTFYKGIRLQGIMDDDQILNHNDKLKAGDIILKIDTVNISTPAALIKEVAMHNVGDKVSLTLLRDGKLTVVNDLEIH